MTYQLLLKKHLREKNNILNFQQQKSALPAKEMVQNQVIPQINAQLVEVMVKLDLIRDFLLFNKHVHNAKELERKLLTHAQTVMVKGTNKHQKKYL